MPKPRATDRDASLRVRTARGVVWSAVGVFGKQLITFGTLAVLGRTLSPSDFGVMAMVLVFSDLARLLIESGFGSAIIQRQVVDRALLDTCFWTSARFAVLGAALLWIGAPALAWLYRESEVTAVARWMAPQFLAAALCVVPHALLVREFRMAAIAGSEITAAALGAAVAIWAAFEGFGPRALAFQLLVTQCALAAVLIAVTRYRPGRADRDRTDRALRDFSRPLLGANLLNHGIRRADDLLIGTMLGRGPLGVYSQAYRLMLAPIGLLIALLSRTLYPAMARVQDDVDKLRSVWLRSHAAIALITMPGVVLLFVLADPLVKTILGPAPHWAEVIPVLEVLCFAAILQPINATVAWVYQATGRTDTMLRWTWLASGVSLLAFVAGLPWGPFGVALGYTVSRYLLWYPGLTMASRLIDVGFVRIVTNLADSFGLALITGVAVAVLGAAVPAGSPPWVDLVGRGTAGAAIFVILVWWFRPRGLRALLDAFAAAPTPPPPATDGPR